MKYIPLDEVLEILNKNQWSDDWIHTRISTNSIEEIEKLKTINLSIIDKMIEENIEYPDNDHNLWYRSSLQELKERLSLNK